MFRIEDVVTTGKCIGCGACSVATSGHIPVAVGPFGFFQASLDGVDEATRRLGSKVCPFSDESRNEDEIAGTVLSHIEGHDDRLGRYISTKVARVEMGDDLRLSSSGGLTSFVTLELLKRNKIDGVIHVGQGNENLFAYRVSHSAEEVRAHRKSIYYSTCFADALHGIKGDGKRYAFIGVPCFVRAARLLCEEDSALASQLKYFLGLVCGHLKSAAYAEALSWQVGVAPNEIAEVDFRIKLEGKPSSEYAFGVRAKGGDEILSRPMKELVGSNWGHGFFQMEACNYCDDIFAETADVAFGDAWLEEFKADWRGTNIIVNRSPEIERILSDCSDRGEIFLEQVSLDAVANSQAGNFRHRWDGLSVRLADDLRAGRAIPQKRIIPNSRNVSKQRKALIRHRRLISAQTHRLFAAAKKEDSLDSFVTSVAPLVRRYSAIERGNQFSQTSRRVLQIFTLTKSTLSRLLRIRSNKMALTKHLRNAGSHDWR